MKVGSVYLWQNGMVMTFGEDGHQMPDLQGRNTPELLEKISLRSSPTTSWIGFGPDGACDFQQMKHRFSCPGEGAGELMDH